MAAFRGLGIGPDERMPEDWLASTTTVFGRPEEGLTRLADGRLLRDAIRADPVGVLGREHVAVFGPDPALLVKLLDAQQRLSVHIHPDRAFARSRLGVRYGKTEAWHVLAADAGAIVHLGFREPIEADELLDVVERGAGASLLGRMHNLAVAPGDTVFVPAGAPHAIGEGIFLIEAQEPSDLLVRLESSGYAVANMPSDLGLGFAAALQAVDRTAWDVGRLAGVVTRHAASGGRLLPEAARGFFRIERPVARPEAELDPGFKVLVILGGRGSLRANGQSLAIKAGDCLMVPWASGRVALLGDVEAICCRPADPAAAQAFDPDLAKFAASQASSDSSNRGFSHEHDQSCC